MPQLLRRLYVFAFVFALNNGVSAQACFQIESILVDACGTPEGENEMVRFRIGNAPLQTNALAVVWANTASSWSGVCQNANTASKVAQINATIENCGYLIEPTSGVLPANSEVILITSVNFNPANNSFANLSDTLLVIFHCGTSTTGYFANAGSGIRTLIMNFAGAGGCSQTVSYDRSQLIGGDGALANFDEAGNDSYSNQGCSAPIIIPDPSWTPPSPICNSAPAINLTTLITGTLGGTWSGPGVSGNTFNPSGFSGDVDITYTVGVEGCLGGSSSETNTVSVIGNSSASWTSPGTVCNTAAPINLNGLVTGTSGGTFSGTGVTGNVFNPSGLNENVPITYTVGSGSCISTSVELINVLPGGDPTWEATSICNSDSPIDLFTLVTGDLGGTWSGQGVTGNTFNPQGLSGPINVTYTIGAGGCPVSLTRTFTVSQEGIPSWNTTTICETEDSFDLNTLITGSLGGTWSGAGVSGTTFTAQNLSGNIPLTYSVGSGSCEDQLTQNITIVSAPPAPVVASDTAYCQGQTPPLLTVNALPGASVSWFNLNNPEAILSTALVFAPPADVTGIFAAKQSISGCESNFNSVEVIVNPSPNEPSYTGTAVICSDFLANPINIIASPNSFWYSDAAQTNLVNQGLTFPAGAINSSFTSFFISSIENGCPSTILEIPLLREDSISANILGNEVINACLPDEIQLSSQDADLNLWSTGSASSTISITSEGVYYLTRSNTCNSAIDSVTVFDVGADASFDLFVPQGALVPVNIQISNFENGCMWLLDGDEILLDAEYGFTITEEQDYYLEHICENDFGCADTVGRIIKIQTPSELYIPNAFTPNGDGDNEVFIAKSFKIRDLTMLVYNRWGELVFESNDPLIGWDGRTLAKTEAVEGIYTYLIKAIDIYDVPYDFYGSVLLFR